MTVVICLAILGLGGYVFRRMRAERRRGRPPFLIGEVLVAVWTVYGVAWLIIGNTIDAGFVLAALMSIPMMVIPILSGVFAILHIKKLAEAGRAGPAQVSTPGT